MNLKAQNLFHVLTKKPSPERLAEVTDLFRRCENAVNDGDGEIEPLLDQLETATGKRWTAEFFFELWGWTDPEDLAEIWTVPAPEPIELNEEELSDFLEQALAPEAIPADKIWAYLEMCFGDAFNNGLVYYPYREMDAKEMAAEVFHRKSILDTKGPDGLVAYECEIAEDILAAKDAKPWTVQWAASTLFPNDRRMQNKIIKQRFP